MTQTRLSGVLLVMVLAVLGAAAQPPAFLSVSPSNLGAFTCSPDTPGTFTSFFVVHTGNFPTTWTLTVTQTGGRNWLSVSPTSGIGATTVYFTVSCGMPPGHYEATITISAIAASNSPLVMTASCDVPTTPVIYVMVTPASVSYSFEEGGSTAEGQLSLTQVNFSGGFNWSASTTTAKGCCWLTVSPESDFSFRGPKYKINTANLIPGVYSGEIVITYNYYVGLTPLPENRIPVTVLITPHPPAPVLTVSPRSLTASVNSGATTSQTLQIRNTGTGTLNWRAGPWIPHDQGSGWLAVSPASGAGDGAITVRVDAANLAPGTYWGVVSVVDNLSKPSQVDLRVDLTVTPALPKLAVSSTSLQLAARMGTNPAPTHFEVRNAGGGALGWTATATGGDWLKISPATGTAPSTVTVTADSSRLVAGTYNASINVSALDSAQAANSPQVVTVTLVVGAPAAVEGGVVNGASFSKGEPVSPGSLASLFGTDLAAGTASAGSLPLPTTLAATQVLLNGSAAPLFYVAPSQINFQVPTEISGSSFSIQVTSAALRGNTLQVPLTPSAPGLFQSGTTAQGVVLNEDYTLNSSAHPAAVGSVVQIFATGLGATDPQVPSGQPAPSIPPLALTVQTPSVLVSGIAAEVLFSGLSPGFAGLYQINIRLPQSVSGNAVTLQLSVAGRASNTVTVAVR